MDSLKEKFASKALPFSQDVKKFLKEHGGTFTCHPVHCGSHSWLTGYEIRLEFPKKAGSKALSFRSHVYRFFFFCISFE